MPTNTWKAVERGIAKLLDGRRVGILGDHDVEAGVWDIEVKHGKQIPKTILKWWSQANKNTREGQKPMLVLHYPRQSLEDCLVFVRLGDLLSGRKGD